MICVDTVNLSEFNLNTVNKDTQNVNITILEQSLQRYKEYSHVMPVTEAILAVHDQTF